MYGRPISSSSPSSRNVFSAADAYATPGTSSSSPYQDTHSHDLEQQPSRHAAQQSRQSNRHDEEDDAESSEDEGWNVYDDFNNATALNTFDTPDGKASSMMGSDVGYFAKGGAGGYGNSPMDTPPVSRQVPAGTQRNSTLLTAESFGFDVQHADPRHPSVLAAEAMHDGSGHIAHSHSVSGGGGISDGTPTGKGESGIELITVPALGQEFTKDEMKRMSRPYRRKAKAARRKEKVSRWGKGEYKICGWLSPRWAVVISFFALVFLGVALYFVIPRVPGLAFSSTQPLEAVPNSASMVTHYSPTNFSMTMDLNLRADNTGGWIPTHATSIKVEVTELTTHTKIGTGSLSDGMTFPGRKKTIFKVPVDFMYRSLNITGDPTFSVVHSACQHQYNGVTRPNLNLNVKLSMKIAGLVGTKETGTNINTPCPFELQNDQ